MDVFLIQHAQAKSSDEDPTRPLSEEGKSNIRSVAEYAGKLGVTVDRIYHSGKLRAQQTAEILAKHLDVVDRVEEKSGLYPGDRVTPIKDWLEELVSEALTSIMIVGHLPFLDKLASLLVAGVEDAKVVAVQNAGIIKLVPKSTERGYSISWILTPDLVQRS